MAIDVAIYLEKLKPKEGKLEQWEADIFRLFHAAASYRDIVAYLKLNGTMVTRTEVYHFIHRKKRRHLLNINAVTASVPENEAQASQTGQSGQQKPQALAPVPQPPPQHGSTNLPRFNWRENQKKDKPKW